MYGEWTKKNVPLKEKREGYRQFVFDHNWPSDVLLDGKPCGCTSYKGTGTLKIAWFGEYIGVDWHLQRRVSFRCNHCGKCVTFLHVVPNEGEQDGGIVRQVIE
jgi:hypothetical protein